MQTISNGTTASISAGGSEVGDVVLSGGTLDVLSGGSANSTILSGGTENVAGTEQSATVSSGGHLNVLSGGTAQGVSVSSGGTLDVAGFQTSNTTIFDGGVENVLAGGDAQSFLVATGGTLYVESSGTAEFFTLSGGSATVFSGGVIHDFTVSSGATLNLFGMATSNSLIASGGVENVSSGGVETGTVGGTVNVFSGGTVDFSGVQIDGQLKVLAGGSAHNNLVLGGEEDVYGLATSTTLQSATDTIIGSPTSGQSFAGREYVFSGGVASATTVGAGGDLVVSSGGVASDTNVMSGGTLEVLQGGKFADGGFTLEEQASGGTTLIGPVVVSGSTGTLTIGPDGLPILGNTLDFGGAPSQLENFLISGFGDGDTIDLTSVNYVAAGASANLLAGNELEVKVGGVTYDFHLNTGQSFAGEFFHVSDDGNGQTDITENMSPCYCPGTLITTDRGEIAIEKLAIGDKVVTMSGKVRPIKWIGRRSYTGRFACGQKHILPVCIQAGALGDHLPTRDLWLSPQHAMYLQGVLIEAKDLVNDLSIIQASTVDSVTYIHIELETHDVIIAEGAFSETFVDDDSRAMFHNAHEYRELYAGEPHETARYYAPRLRDGYQVEAARRHIDALAGLRQDPSAQDSCETASLSGFVDVVAPKLISGWAQTAEHPAVPVCLEIVADGRVIGQVLANRYRQDLEQAGLGNGRHGFAFTPSSAKTFRHVEVRRAMDGAALRSAAILPVPVQVTRSRKRLAKR